MSWHCIIHVRTNQRKPNISLSLWWTDGVIYQGSQQSVVAWSFGKNSGLSALHLAYHTANHEIPWQATEGRGELKGKQHVCMCVCFCVCLGSPWLNSPSAICFLRVWVHYFCLCGLLCLHCLWIHLYLWFFIRMSRNTITSIPRLCSTLEIEINEQSSRLAYWGGSFTWKTRQLLCKTLICNEWKRASFNDNMQVIVMR